MFTCIYHKYGSAVFNILSDLGQFTWYPYPYSPGLLQWYLNNRSYQQVRQWWRQNIWWSLLSVYFVPRGPTSFRTYHRVCVLEINKVMSWDQKAFGITGPSWDGSPIQKDRQCWTLIVFFMVNLKKLSNCWNSGIYVCINKKWISHSWRCHTGIHVKTLTCKGPNYSGSI